METRLMTPASPLAPMLEAAVRAARVFRNLEPLLMILVRQTINYAMRPGPAVAIPEAELGSADGRKGAGRSCTPDRGKASALGLLRSDGMPWKLAAAGDDGQRDEHRLLNILARALWLPTGKRLLRPRLQLRRPAHLQGGYYPEKWA